MINRLHLTNFSDRSIRYELSWPAHCITVRPEQGVVTSRGTCVICVSANTLLRSKDVRLPWSGNLHITCDNQQQVRASCDACRVKSLPCRASDFFFE